MLTDTQGAYPVTGNLLTQHGPYETDVRVLRVGWYATPNGVAPDFAPPWFTQFYVVPRSVANVVGGIQRATYQYFVASTNTNTDDPPSPENGHYLGALDVNNPIIIPRGQVLILYISLATHLEALVSTLYYEPI